jgi:hypothetical protein
MGESAEGFQLRSVLVVTGMLIVSNHGVKRASK